MTTIQYRIAVTLDGTPVDQSVDGGVLSYNTDLLADPLGRGLGRFTHGYVDAITNCNICDNVAPGSVISVSPLCIPSKSESSQQCRPLIDFAQGTDEETAREMERLIHLILSDGRHVHGLEFWRIIGSTLTAEFIRPHEGTQGPVASFMQ